MNEIQTTQAGDHRHDVAAGKGAGRFGVIQRWKGERA